MWENVRLGEGSGLRLRRSLIIEVHFEVGRVWTDKENKGEQSLKNFELRNKVMKTIF